jgi:hypothetical protein
MTETTNASWEAVLAFTKALPQPHTMTSLSRGESADATPGEHATQATYRAGQADGTHKVYEITVSVKESTDSNDEFWGEGIGLVGFTNPTNVEESRRVVVDGVHYMLGDDKPGDAFKGFAGRRFDIEFFDGRKVTTRDLWHQGTIPPKWRKRYPDNARFVTEAGAR